MHAGGVPLGRFMLETDTVGKSGYTKPALVKGQLYTIRGEEY